MQQEEQYKEIGLREMINALGAFSRFVLQKWWIILPLGLLGGLGGIYYAWKQKPKYESMLSFALDDKTAGVGGALSLASELGFGGGGGRDVFAGENITVILNSRRIIEGVLLMNDTLDGKVQTMAGYWINIHKNMDNHDEPGLSRMKQVSFPPGMDRSQFSYLQDSVLYAIYDGFSKSHLKVSKPDRRLNYYEVRFTGPDERFSKIFVEKLVTETRQFYTELRSAKSRDALAVLENRVAALKGTARGAISSQAAVQDANINPAFARANASVAQSQIDINAYGKAYEELFKMMEMARYQYLNDIPLLQVIDEPHYPMKKIKLGRKKAGIIGGLILGGLGFLIVAFLWVRKKYQSSMVSSSSTNAANYKAAP